MKIGFLIPSRNRPEDLTRLLTSLKDQARPADYILVIDGSDPELRYQEIIKKFSSLPIHYLEVFPPGLTKQRNKGLDAVPDNLDLIGFLDDDLELFPDAVEKMMEFWEAAGQETGGASFNIVNNYFVKPTIFHRVFLINNGKGGTFMPSGTNLILHPVERDTEVEWLSGGATVWRSEIFKENRFEEKYGGYGSLDDLDFSLSLGKKYRLMVLRDAKVKHLSHPIKGDRMKHFGEYDVVYRYHFIKRFGFSRLAYFWATLGRILAYGLTGIVKRDKRKTDYAAGFISGLGQIIRGRENIQSHDLK